MESTIYTLMAKHGDLLLLVVGFIVVYIKLSFLTGKVNNVCDSLTDHWKFHLEQNGKKGV